MNREPQTVKRPKDVGALTCSYILLGGKGAAELISQLSNGTKEDSLEVHFKVHFFVYEKEQVDA